MDSNFNKVYYLVILIILSKATHAQIASQHRDTIRRISQSVDKKTISRIKWTWQLPAPVRKAFNQSQYKDCFIENMKVYDSSGKTFYRFFFNNGNLLDGDHYDSFLKKGYLDISDSGVIVRN